MVYSIGVKELWEVPKGRLPRGAVIHTMGYPLDTRTFGGGFIYGFTDERISVGLVVGLDYHDPFLDPHALFQQLQGAPAPEGDARGREDGALRGAHDQRGRLVLDPAALRRRRAPGRGRRRAI